MAANKIILLLANSSSLEANTISFVDAYFRNELYQRANWINCMIMAFTVLTQFSSVLLVNLCVRTILKKDDISGFGAAAGSALILAFTAMLAILLIGSIGRKSLLMLGFATMTALHLLIGTLNQTRYDQKTLTYMTGFIIVYVTTMGPISWLYAAET